MVFTFNKRDLLIVVILLQNHISLSSSPHYDNYYKNASPGKGGKMTDGERGWRKREREREREKETGRGRERETERERDQTLCVIID